MNLGIPVSDGVNLLDAAGPYEMFNWVDKKKGSKAVILSPNGGSVKTMNGVRFEAHGSFCAFPKLDVLWAPGGDPDVLGQIMSDLNSEYLAYLRQAAPGAKWVCSVCEGALLLARAGLLDRHKATTHWAFLDCLRSFPIEVDTLHKRFVESGNRLTGGGISSGLDEALRLIMLLFDRGTAEAVHRVTQSFPDPPVSGSIPAKGRPVKWKTAEA
jgi:cyclohexyl-isocyanide hydratase